MYYRLLNLLFFFCIFLYQSARAQLLSWGHSTGNSANEYQNSIAADAAGNTYTSCSFVDTIDADPGPGIQTLISAGESDTYVAKFNEAGTMVWTFAISGTGSSEAEIWADAAGNLLVAGNFTQTIDVDPGPGSVLLSDAGMAMFIARYDATGQLLWAKKAAGGSNYLTMFDITGDAAGNLYFTGALSGNAVDFDPGPAVYPLGVGSDWSEFILKLDASGNFSWARVKLSAVSGSANYAYSIATDPSGNVYTTGFLDGTVDFNSGAGVFNLTANGLCDAYLCKLDASGNFIWAIRTGSGPGQELGKGVEVDVAGNIYTTGLFEQTNDFDPGIGIVQVTAVGFADAFITKYNSSGALQWVKTIGGHTGNEMVLPTDLAMDEAGNLYSTGLFLGGTVDFDPGSGVYDLTPAAGVRHTYFSKLNNNGTFIMAGSIEGGDNLSDKITTDGCGTIYLSGMFAGTIDAEPSTSYNPVVSTAGSNDLYFLKLSQSFWTGNVSTDWHDPLNWACNTVPGVRSNVIIPTGAIRFPFVFSNAEIKSITVKPTASVEVATGIELKVNSGN